jgi:hypothetical protein
MKRFFYAGLIGIGFFEILHVYFIMPMPGSQQMDSLALAYFLHSYRWIFRGIFLILILIGAKSVLQSKTLWLPISIILLVAAISYVFNFRLTAEQMFKQPANLVFKKQHENQVNPQQIALLVEINNEAKAYPIEYIAYHHQVEDVLGGREIIVTYCSVCRTGRVFEPIVKGKQEKFRLVGMDHFNAMFEDQSTKSWWRQVNGEAVAGPLKGELLPELESMQLSLEKIFELYPQAKVMQADRYFMHKYDSLFLYEQGFKQSKLTGTDTASWNDKSWVVGIEIENQSKAYDWNQLKQVRVINDVIGGKPIALVLAADDKSFAAYSRTSLEDQLIIENDMLYLAGGRFNFSGRSLQDSIPSLQSINAYQEFWHSWKTFHPQTEKYQADLR